MSKLSRGYGYLNFLDALALSRRARREERETAVRVLPDALTRLRRSDLTKRTWDLERVLTLRLVRAIWILLVSRECGY